MISTKVINKVLHKASATGADFAELFAEDRYDSRLSCNDNKIKQSVVGRDYGAGVRVFNGQTVIYAYTNDLTQAGLLRAAEAVSHAMPGHGNTRPIDLCRTEVQTLHPVTIPCTSVDRETKIGFVRSANEAARNYDTRISQADISYAESMQHILVANSEGVLVEDDRHYTRISVRAIASSGTEKQTGSVSPGAHAGYEFIRALDPSKQGKEAGRIAVTMLTADYAPSGKLPVVIDNGFGGVIFHEACGHALETTSVAKNASIFAGKMGQRIANSAVTAIDDGTIPNAWGSENVDDEGTPTRKTVLIKDGVLTSYMVDRMGSIKTGYEATGNGRRQSYRFAPASRMRNTYIAPGRNGLEDLLNSVDYGIYAKKMGGGSVQPGTGDFNFAVAEGYVIRDGQVCEPVRGATLIGNGAETLMRISMVADNLDFGQGMCGSVSGSLPANVGQAAVRVDEIVVGGRKEAG